MDIIGISCGRKNGNNELLLKRALMAAEEEGAHCAMICLRDLEIKQCTGCESCMRGLISGGDGRCVLKGDNYDWLMDQVTAAQGLIIAAPVYDLIPCGRLITLLNRALGAGRDRREYGKAHPTAAAAIAVGGSDWTDLAEPLLQLSLTNLCKGAVTVDRLVRGGNTAPAMALLDEGLVERAALLGRRVARAAAAPEQAAYEGDRGICPVCGCNLIEPLVGNTAVCAFCHTRGTLSAENGQVVFQCSPEDRTYQRFSELGEQEHQADIRAAHQKAAQGREVIWQRLTKYTAYDVTLAPDRQERKN